MFLKYDVQDKQYSRTRKLDQACLRYSIKKTNFKKDLSYYLFPVEKFDEIEWFNQDHDLIFERPNFITKSNQCQFCIYKGEE